MNTNVKQVVPFLWVTDIERSVKFYTEGLNFEMINKWVDKDKLRWCWLQWGGAAIMLQEYLPERIPQIKRGEGVSVCFQCTDAVAIYHDALSKNIVASEPEVGNSMWVTLIIDPDGYKLDFESHTEVPEETKLSEWKRIAR